MDLKIVIRQLLDKGLTREQVISNLQELGVSDAEKLFDEAVGAKPTPKPVEVPEEKPVSRGLFKQIDEEPVKAQPIQMEPKPITKKKGEVEIHINDLVESQGKSLFQKELEPPQVEVIKEVESVEDKPVKTWKAPEKDPTTLEEKIDEALALLKALESINEKILETDRKLLLRSKS